MSARGRALLSQAFNQTQAEIWAEYEDIVDRNNAAMDRAATGRLIGAIGLPLLGTGLSMIPGAPIAMQMLGSVGGTTALAGIGSRIGSEMGEHDVLGPGTVGDMFSDSGGVNPDELTQRGMAENLRRDLSDQIEAGYGDFDQNQWTQAAMDMGTAYLTAGGPDAFAATEGANAFSRIGQTLRTPTSAYANPFYLIPGVAQEIGRQS